jgi:hypothetical protein
MAARALHSHSQLLQNDLAKMHRPDFRQVTERDVLANGAKNVAAGFPELFGALLQTDLAEIANAICWSWCFSRPQPSTGIDDRCVRRRRP